MELRRLGRTGLQVSEIGLGTEYLHGQPRTTVVSVVKAAREQGVNYLDVIYSFPEYLDNLGAALKGGRAGTFIAVHLGCAETGGQYRKSRNVQECAANFTDMLRRLGIDHADVLMVQNVDERDERLV